MVSFLSGFVSRAQKRQQEYEAQFRVSHSRVVLNSESINFYGGAKTEADILDGDLVPVKNNLAYFGWVKLPLDFVNMFIFAGTIVLTFLFAGMTVLPPPATRAIFTELKA